MLRAAGRVSMPRLWERFRPPLRRMARLPWVSGLRVGVELVSALAVAVAIGWALDKWLHTLPLFLSLFVVLGGAAGRGERLAPGSGRKGAAGARRLTDLSGDGRGG